VDVTFTQSAFPPLALGFFGLGTGYLIYGPKELLGWPKGREGDEARIASRRLPSRRRLRAAPVVQDSSCNS
jgi:hypothetical protein